jgi:hypothetical protein
MLTAIGCFDLGENLQHKKNYLRDPGPSWLQRKIHGLGISIKPPGVKRAGAKTSARHEKNGQVF